VNSNVAQEQQKEQDLTPQEQFTGKNLTRFGGTGLIRRFFEKHKLSKHLETVSVRDRRNSDYTPAQMCMGMLYALMLGIFRPSHMMELVRDKVFQSVAKLKKFPVQSTISRFLDKVTVHTAIQIADINSRLLNVTRGGFEKFNALTLDLDSHVITVFGKQHRANKGYNPKKRGRKSYHPLLCFIGETRDYLGGILRPGNSTDANQARSFLTLMLQKLPFGMATRLRADSGFFHMDFIRWLVWREIEFYIVVPQLVYIQKLVLRIGTWREISPNVAVGETLLPLNSHRKLRLVVVRKTVKAGEKARKQLKLFKTQPLAYDYQVIATSSLDAGETVWRFYNKRACCENFIKEGIYGFGLDKSVCRSWAGAKVHFELVMLTYNLMNWFKEEALSRGANKEMAGTIRWKLFWIPAKLVATGRRLILKLAEDWIFQDEFESAVKSLT
jgi:Transposase DDE domain group 1